MDVFGWISSTDAQGVLIGIAVVVASLTTIAVAGRTIARTKPGRWLRAAVAVIGRTLIGDPIARTMHRALDEWAAKEGGPVQRIDARLVSLEEQNKRNGGTSQRDRLNAVAEAVGAAPDPTPPHSC